MLQSSLKFRYKSVQSNPMKLKTTTGHITINMPDKLGQVTLGQLIAMQAAANLSDLELIGILSGTPLTSLQNICNANDLEPLIAQVQSIAHQLKYLYNSDALPKNVRFTINDKVTTVKVIKNLSVEPAGAFMASREIIAEEIAKHVEQFGEKDWQENFNPSLTACAQVLAQYFYCRTTGKLYNEYASAEFEEQIKQLPVTDALPIAKYFFLSYPNLSKPRTGCWPRLRRRWSSARVLLNFSGLNTSTPLMP